MTHPSTIRRRARKAGEPPKPPGRKPAGEVAKVTCSLSLDPAAKARLVAAAKARGVSVSALVEAWAMSLPESLVNDASAQSGVMQGKSPQ